MGVVGAVWGRPHRVLLGYMPADVNRQRFNCASRPVISNIMRIAKQMQLTFTYKFLKS